MLSSRPWCPFKPPTTPSHPKLSVPLFHGCLFLHSIMLLPLLWFTWLAARFMLYVTSQITGGRKSVRCLGGPKKTYLIWKMRVHLFLLQGSITGLQSEDEWVLRWPRSRSLWPIHIDGGCFSSSDPFGPSRRRRCSAGQNLMHSSFWLYKCHYLSSLCGLTRYTWVEAVPL